MALYAFILGSHPILSYAEIINLLRIKGMISRELSYNPEFALLSIEALEPSSFQEALGGTIKIVEIKARGLKNLYQIEELLTEERLFRDFLAKESGKITIGIAAYSLREWSGSERRFLKMLGINLKELLKEKHRVRYVLSPDFNLTSVVVADLIKDGAEIVILREGREILLGKTVSVQDVRRYKERDYDRPERDLLSGMLPPKLAQMMINLVRTKESQTVFDPFCGSGGILQEALLLGLEIYGSDIDEKVLQGARDNIRWALKVKERRAPAHFEKRFRVADATSLKWPALNKKETIIVTEPYLGPPQRKMMLPNEAANLMKELKKIYLGFFRNLANHFSRIKRVGLVLPIFKTTAGLVFLEMLDEVRRLGYKKVAILPEELLKKESGLTRRGGFLYSRPDQFVLREIFIFEK